MKIVMVMMMIVLTVLVSTFSQEKEFFDAELYLEQNPDVAEAGVRSSSNTMLKLGIERRSRSE